MGLVASGRCPEYMPCFRGRRSLGPSFVANGFPMRPWFLYRAPKHGPLLCMWAMIL